MPVRTWRRLSRLEEGLGRVSAASPHPFLQPAFLHALECSGAVGPGTAWEVAHILFEREGQGAALLPLYRKQDSRGEYVFDHSWAAAYERHGLAYYPKLVTAVPFTPVPGPRLLLAPGEHLEDWLPFVLQTLREVCTRENISGWHGLFVEEDWLETARTQGFAIREGCRFHWDNPGYRDFDDFLDQLTSKKRKDLKRERRRLLEQGIVCRTLQGHDIDEAAWDFFHACYVRTYHEHGQQPYLNRDFFRQLAGTMAENLMLVIAEDADGLLASALFLHDNHTLYGRYWGSLRRADGLHFEVCYYQGMEFCLRKGLQEFDPGTQGEHKLLRGFAPRRTYSLHWLRAPEFQDAISRFVSEERVAIQRYHEEAESLLPFRSNIHGAVENGGSKKEMPAAPDGHATGQESAED
ncbi:MAG: GNAT family N-acetyltransferase [bacterium]|nr:GNAT family N-acetyltransferase [bacterium]